MHSDSPHITFSDADIVAHGRSVVHIEAEALAELESRIDASFARAVSIIYQSRGRVIVSGVGKSGIIARKIVATMNSTGTPALFLHPSEAIHGDLGMVMAEDVVLAISKSGDTQELKNIMPVFKRIGVKVIAMVGAKQSALAQAADVTLDVSVREEACPYDLAPTASTTTALAMGDALAIALLKQRGFTADDFALYHPGGNLGKRLLLRIEDVMATGEAVPCVHQSVALKDTILEMTSKRFGATCVLDDGGRLAGIITDGDLRRLLERDTDLTSLIAFDVMSRTPKTLHPNVLASYALETMERFKITQLVIVDHQNRPIGIVHLHMLVQLGLR